MKSSALFIVIADELKSAFRSRKALILLTVYGGFFLLAAHGIAVAQAWAEDRIQALGVSESQVKMGQFFLRSGFDTSDGLVDFLIQAPFFLLLFFTLSLSTLPLLIGLMSYDALSQEISNRTMRFLVFRARPASIYFGKFVAHFIQFSLISVVMTLLVILYTFIKVENTVSGNVFGYAFHYWVLLQPFLAALVAFSLLLSSFFKKPLLAWAFFGTMLFAISIQWPFLSIFDMKLLYYLFHPFGPELATGLGMILGYTALYLGLGLWALHRRDF